MKTIFLCIPSLTSAGAERFVTELAISINKDKYKVIVIVTKKYDENTYFYKKLILSNILVIDATSTNYFFQLFKLINLMNQYQPSIVHSNVYSALYMLIPALLFKKKTSHLFTVHSMGYRIFNGFKKKIMQFCFYKKIIIPIAICDTVKKSVSESYNLKLDDIECVYNGVDTNTFVLKRKERKGRKKSFNFIIIGTLYHIKNHEFLIKAFKIVNDLHNETKLFIIGDGELREDLEQLVNSLKLDRNIVFCGNQADVIPYLSNADVYCCSSKVEGLPISVLEAMSCSLPVITTPAGGVVDIVIDGINGYVESDIEKYAKRMIELFDNSDIRNKMSIEARKKALTFDLKKCAEEYENLYDKYSK